MYDEKKTHVYFLAERAKIDENSFHRGKEKYVLNKILVEINEIHKTVWKTK